MENASETSIRADVAFSEPKRFAWITGLKREARGKYEEMHVKVWDSVNRRNKACHIQNFSINEIEIDSKLYLIAHLEYTGTDFEADMRKMAEDPEIQRWWKETDAMQLPLPPAAAKGKIWTDMKEVYFLR